MILGCLIEICVRIFEFWVSEDLVKTKGLFPVGTILLDSLCNMLLLMGPRVKDQWWRSIGDHQDFPLFDRSCLTTIQPVKFKWFLFLMVIIK